MCGKTTTIQERRHHLAREIPRVANKVQKGRKKGNYMLTIRWTAGHEGMPTAGNEEADREAKKAAEGKHQTSDSYPHISESPC